MVRSSWEPPTHRKNSDTIDPSTIQSINIMAPINNITNMMIQLVLVVLCCCAATIECQVPSNSGIGATFVELDGNELQLARVAHANGVRGIIIDGIGTLSGSILSNGSCITQQESLQLGSLVEVRRSIYLSLMIDHERAIIILNRSIVDVDRARVEDASLRRTLVDRSQLSVRVGSDLWTGVRAAARPLGSRGLQSAAQGLWRQRSYEHAVIAHRIQASSSQPIQFD